ncbi:SKP1-like protein 21 [Sesamum angolense]|uniref:SKP1-like protein 21 n=1 Tax=Sesamum angolense TaxID=2727404 RepID=A0AAE1XHA9_9LAMI|nr:SKP1-like protein 21 [Sesamum angolense]
MNKKESNELDSVCSNSSLHGKLLTNVCHETKLLEIEDDGLAAEDEFDDCDLDDDIDPALKEKIDREVEDFARRLNSDWPERMQEILSLGQEKRPLRWIAYLFPSSAVLCVDLHFRMNMHFRRWLESSLTDVMHGIDILHAATRICLDQHKK